VRRFVELYTELDETNKTTAKVAAMVRYFREAPAEDAVWGLYFLTGRRPKRPLHTTKLWEWAMELTGLPPWLFSESYDAVGDLAETIATILPDQPEAGAGANVPLHRWMEERFFPMYGMDEGEQRQVIETAWAQSDRAGRFVWNKLITGAFRVGVSQDLVIRALAEAFSMPASTIAHRLMGSWEPTAEFYESLARPEDDSTDISKPYPFCLAHPLAQEPETLGIPDEWLVEHKWDGIRCQVLRRNGQTFVWSRGEELISERFPEVATMGDHLPDGTALDGEIMAWREDRPLPFADLQRRIGRKIVGKKLLVDVPVVLVAFDLLEWEGRDLRSEPLSKRRELLDRIPPTLPEDAALRVSPRLACQSWEALAEERAASRERQVEGLMLKRLDSPYVVGRKKGFWWKWKVDPYSVDAVLMYAARGNGIRASLYTDYTFGIWKEGELVPFAKAYSGLTNEELREVDAWVRRHTVEKFGPVRTVTPELVFELAFEGIQVSNRHKSGIAVRFPRIARWRKDKAPKDADSLETVRALLGS
jgi:DNA ligase 1